MKNSKDLKATNGHPLALVIYVPNDPSLARVMVDRNWLFIARVMIGHAYF